MIFILLFNDIKPKINYFNFDNKLFVSSLNYIPLNLIVFEIVFSIQFNYQTILTISTENLK